MAAKNKLVLRWSQRAHCWFWGRPKGHIRAPKGHSALWKRPSENPGMDHNFPEYTLILTLSRSQGRDVTSGSIYIEQMIPVMDLCVAVI